MAEGEAIVAEPLKAVAGDTVSPAQFIEHIETVSGLLLEREVGEYQFAHLSFQEYLASAQIKETGQLKLLVDNIDQTWWHETIRLYAAKNDTTELVEAALRNPSISTLTIAYDCLEEGKSLAPETRQRLEEMSLESADPDIVKLAAEVKLARRLTRLLRVDELIQIDSGYITWAEFQLFLQDTAQTRKPAQRLPLTGLPSQVVTGISLELALAFCVWLGRWEVDSLESQFGLGNETGLLYRLGLRDGTGFFYRLPTQSEITQTPVTDYPEVEAWTIGADELAIRGLRVVKQQFDMDYAALDQYLSTQDWERADQQTAYIVLKLLTDESLTVTARRVVASEGIDKRIAAKDFERLPSSCLQLLDQFWVHYSGGRYGFGMQASLWQLSNRAMVNANDRFEERVGWNATSEGKELATVQRPGYYPRQCASTHVLTRFMSLGLEQVLPLVPFKMVTLTPQGRQASSEQKEARLRVEDLGKGVSLEMVAIPGGSFVMGSPEDEEGRYDREGPEHEVTISPFFMGRYPITQAQWRQVAALPKVRRRLKANPSHFKGDNLPVEKVSWDEAVEFCDRLSAYTNLSYRLPSEAEWEYACRARTTTAYHFGETITPEIVNHNQHFKRTTEVGKFSVANAFGLHDMHGNVWEWCQDDWHENYNGAPTDGSAWVKGGDQTIRLLRGGSWDNDPWVCRSAGRIRINADGRLNVIGFRVVCSPPRTFQ